MNTRCQLLPFCVVAVMSVTPLLSVAAGVDQLKLGDAASEKAHAVRGEAKPVNLKSRVGTLDLSNAARVVEGKGKTLEFDLKASGKAKANEPLVLEIQEIHDRRPEVFGYTVEVNGKPVYFRTYEEFGAGPNHYFVKIDPNLVKDGKVAVKLINEGDAPFAIGQVWLYDDFSGLAASEGTYRKMNYSDDPAALLGEPKFKDAALPGVSEEEYNTRLWEKMKAKFEGSPYVPGIARGSLYAFRPEKETRQLLEGELAKASNWNAPSQISFIGTEWGGHPYGADGLGGYFGDVKYSSIRYEADSGKFVTSWPRSAGGVTWPTWNDPQLQQYLSHRMAQALKSFGERRAFLKAQGKNPPLPLICQEWGLSIPYLGDWNNSTVEAAKKDGLELKPSVAPDHKTKMWMFQNLSAHPAKFAENFRKHAGRESILVDRGQTKLPEEQLFDQYYFHTFYPAVQPLHDDRWAGWQTGVGEHVYTTGETGPHVPRVYYDYVIGLGKLVTVNLERGFFKDNLDFIHKLYELGFQWVTPCNTRPGDGDLFLNKTAKEIDEKPADPAVHADPKVLDLRFIRDDTIGSPDIVQTMENVRLADKRGTLNSKEFLQVEDGTKPGRVVYRLSNHGKPFEGDLALQMTGFIADGDENSLEVLIGKDPASMKSVAVLHAKDFVAAPYWPGTRTAVCPLGDSLKGSDAGFLELVFRVKNKNTPPNTRVDEIIVTAPWKQQSGQIGGDQLSVKERRTQRLWIQDRAVFERLQRDYKNQFGEDASYREAAALAYQGRHRSAYKLLSGAMSQALPAKFAVRSHGTLGRYPLTVKLADENKTVLVDVLKADAKGFDLKFTTEEPQAAVLSFEAPCTIEQAGPNHFVLKADAQGKKIFDLDLKPASPDTHSLPRQLSGMVMSGAPGGIMIETQDSALWMDNPIYVPFAANVVRTRMQDGSDVPSGKDPRPMDQIELTINDQGQATEVKSTFGIETGRIKAFERPVLTGQLSNGVIELENGHRYELHNRLPSMTKFQVPGLKEHYRNNSQDDLVKALQPGMEVEIAYCPYTTNGRLPRMVSVKALTQP
jgi:hypothetical protein